MNPMHLDSRYGPTVLLDSSLPREEAAPAASGTVGAAPGDIPAWADIEWDTRAERYADV